MYFSKFRWPGRGQRILACQTPMTPVERRWGFSYLLVVTFAIFWKTTGTDRAVDASSGRQGTLRDARFDRYV